MIVNTIRIAVHARRDEIEIMQLVGATDWFVSWPFIIEGMLVGVFGAVVALAVLAAAAGPVTAAMIGFLDILPVSLGSNFVVELGTGVLLFALIVGGTGASISVRSQLARGAHACPPIAASATMHRAWELLGHAGEVGTGARGFARPSSC